MAKYFSHFIFSGVGRWEGGGAGLGGSNFFENCKLSIKFCLKKAFQGHVTHRARSKTLIFSISQITINLGGQFWPKSKTNLAQKVPKLYNSTNILYYKVSQKKVGFTAVIRSSISHFFSGHLVFKL